MQVAVQVGSSMASFDADGAIPKGMEVRLLIGHSKLEDSRKIWGVLMPLLTQKPPSPGPIACMCVWWLRSSLLSSCMSS